MFTIVAFSFPATSTLLGWMLFGLIATIALGYAKMKEEWYPAIVAVCLMVYPYFFPSGLTFWTIGMVLTALLFLPRHLLPGERGIDMD